MTQKHQKSNQGFTIIEVLIVLAIAGLILLIVFLAVPALQRTARNTQRKNDVGSVLGGVSNYISNNDGQPPVFAQPVGAANPNSVTICGNTGCTGNTEQAKVGFYDPANVILNAALNANPAYPTDENTLNIVVGITCPDVSGGALPAAGSSPRTAVGLYLLENGTSAATATKNCQEQ